MLRLFVSLISFLTLTSCISFETKDYGPDRHVDVSHIPNPIPKDEPRSRGGNPASYEVNGQTYYVLDTARGYRQRGIASWYGYKFHGNKTSNGEVYDMYAMTAAHKTLPLPSYVRVTNLENGKQIIVRVNDRGPFAKGRIIDLSYVAARKLDIVKTGTARVEVEAIDPKSPEMRASNNGAMIQVAAFSDREAARALAQELANSLNLPVTINEVSSNGRRFFRVRLGPFVTHTEVEATMRELSALSYRDAKIIPSGR
jgi:rare lipoprotein A